jgi:hypothetical protein
MRLETKLAQRPQQPDAVDGAGRAAEADDDPPTGRFRVRPGDPHGRSVRAARDIG